MVNTATDRLVGLPVRHIMGTPISVCVNLFFKNLAVV